jgi:hypothetical protein
MHQLPLLCGLSITDQTHNSSLMVDKQAGSSTPHWLARRVHRAQQLLPHMHTSERV